MLGVLSVAVAASGCSKDKPLKPLPTQRRIYVGGIDYSQAGPARSEMFMLDADSLLVTDSFPLPAPSVDAITSADGISLYVVTSNDLGTRTIWKYNLASRSPLWHIDLERWPETPDSRGRIRMFDGGRWLQLNRTIASAVTGEIVNVLPDSLVPFGGTPSGTHCAVGVIAPGDKYPVTLRGFDLASDSSWGQYTPHLQSGSPFGITYTAILLGDSRRVLVIGIQGMIDNAWFVIGDLITGETILQESLIYPFGEILVSPDETKAVASDPSMTLIYDSWPTLDLFDLTVPSHLKRLSWDPHLPGHPEQLVLPGQLCWIPQTNEIVAAAPGDFNSSGPMAVIDATEFAIRGFFQLPGKSEQFEYGIGGMAVGEYTPAR
jgi:hypothetical protein